MGDGKKELLAKAESKLKAARQIVYQLYPTLKNSRLLLSGVQNIFLAMNYTVNAVLELNGKNQGDFEKRYTEFHASCLTRYGFSTTAFASFSKMREVLLGHQKSPMEFVRDDKLVICNEQYEMNVLSIELLRQYFVHAQSFLKRANQIIDKDQSNSQEISVP